MWPDSHKFLTMMWKLIWVYYNIDHRAVPWLLRTSVYARGHKLKVWHTMCVQVYQENIYKEGASFQSFYKVLHDMGPEFSDAQIISFNSTSKGYFGE